MSKASSLFKVKLITVQNCVYYCKFSFISWQICYKIILKVFLTCARYWIYMPCCPSLFSITSFSSFCWCTKLAAKNWQSNTPYIHTPNVWPQSFAMIDQYINPVTHLPIGYRDKTGHLFQGFKWSFKLSRADHEFYQGSWFQMSMKYNIAISFCYDFMCPNCIAQFVGTLAYYTILWLRLQLKWLWKYCLCLPSLQLGPGWIVCWCCCDIFK